MILSGSIYSFSYFISTFFLLTSRIKMLSIVYKVNYSSTCSCWFFSLAFFNKYRHRIRERHTNADNMKKRQKYCHQESFYYREWVQCTNSFTTICSHTLTKISLVFLLFSSLSFPLSLSFLFHIFHSRTICASIPSLCLYNIDPLNLLSIYLYTLFSNEVHLRIFSSC